MPRAWHLTSRPAGLPAMTNFELRMSEPQPLKDGEARVKNGWLSVDPAMRLRMNADTNGYQPSFPLDAPLPGGAVGVVVESRSPDLAVGEKVQHLLGWRDEAVAPAADFRKLPTSDAPIQYYLHHLGVIGFTAYIGLFQEGEAKAGETLFVSAAGGATGSAVVQMGKILGMRVIGSAGGPAKCAMVRELGADAVIDYKAPGTMLEKLRAAAPEGIDVYYDNVGGDHLDAALAMANHRARFPISGMVSSYNADSPVLLNHLMRIVFKRITIRGFIARDNIDAMPEFRRRMGEWIAEGRMKSHETIRDGLESTAAGFVEMFTGDVAGKMLIRL